MADRAISIVVHGPAKVGKTTLAATAPTPMLFLDAENSSRFLIKPDGTPFRRIKWKPLEEAPPENDGTWDLCIVKVTEWKIAIKAYEYLKTHKHPFRSVIIDSISEMQDKLKKQTLGNGETQMKMQDWGKILQSMGAFLRNIRDLTAEDESPIEATVLVAMSRDIKGTMKPHMEGQIVQQVPYLYDMIGYIYQEQVRDEATQEIVDRRALLTVGVDGYEAGNRVHFRRDNGRAVLYNPNISEILDMLFGPSPLDN